MVDCSYGTSGFIRIAFTVINFRALTEYMDNDIYADTLVAKYMWDQKSLFPEGWVFGNQYYVIATPVLSALFYGLTGSINTAMACATTVVAIVILEPYISCPLYVQEGVHAAYRTCSSGDCGKSG